MIKKEKYMTIKKMEYLNRQKILNSLEQHNKSNAKLASELISTKNLGQKRKREKYKNKDKKSLEDKNTEQKGKEKENESNTSSLSSSDEESEEIIKNEENNNKNQTNQPKPLINGLTPQEFLNKLLEEKRQQRQLEEMSEIKQYLYGDNSLYIPSQKSSIIINRSPEIIEQRSKLPIISQEQSCCRSPSNMKL